jgi:hypothetical protein
VPSPGSARRGSSGSLGAGAEVGQVRLGCPDSEKKRRRPIFTAPPHIWDGPSLTMWSIRRGRSFGAAFVNSYGARSAVADAVSKHPNPAFCRPADMPAHQLLVVLYSALMGRNGALLTDPWVFGSARQVGAVAAEGEHG